MAASSGFKAPEIDVYLHQAEIIHRRVRLNLEGFSHEESLMQPKPGGHSANWVLGHLIEIYERMSLWLGQERVLPVEALERYRQGSDPREEPSGRLDLAELLKAWDEVNGRIADGLRGLEAEALDRQDRYFNRNPEPTTLRRYLDMTLFHQAYHSGQLGLLRRLVGKEGAIP